MANQSERTVPRSLLVPVIALVVCLFLWPAMLTFHVGDWPSPNQYPPNDPSANACGAVGGWCAYQLRYFIGDGVFPLLLFTTLAAVLRLVRGEIGQLWERAFGLVLLVTCTAASAHLISTRGSGALFVGNGGLLGYAAGHLFDRNLDRLGTLIVLSASFFVGLLFTTEGWVLKLPAAFGRAARATGEAVATARHILATGSIPQPVAVSAGERAALLDKPARSSKRRGAGKRNVEVEDEEATLFEDATEAEDYAEDEDVDGEWEEDDEVAEEEESGSEDNVVGATESVIPRSSRGKKASASPVVNFPSQKSLAKAEPYPRQIENWTLPSVTLLHEPQFGFDKQQELVVREQAMVLERTLEEFRLDAQVVEIDTGPVITMFELKLGAGIKVSQIASLSNDIARALKAHAIRVVAPIPGKNTVGIEVPNLQKECVRMRELITVAGKRASEMALPLFLGKDASGQPLIADLTRMPHLLIAGTTGSGKSVCLSSVILSLLMTKRPDHVKMILIDPKMVEMTQFKNMPHLMAPLVTDMAQAEKILEWSVTKMDERYELLAEARVKNIAGYNALGAEEIYKRFQPQSEQERASISTFMPYVVIIIDELADLMMTSGKEVEHHLSRLAQKSRAVGIHIIVATQRPEVKIVTGLIKSNLPARICFRVASRMDSRIVLDTNGGEVLLGQGDMLFLPPGSHKLIRAQGTFLEDDEVHAVLDDLASRAKPEYHPELMRIKAPGAGGDAMLRDPLFDQAVRVVLESKRGSVSLLQRRLTIGYSRASRLIEQMSNAGVVGDFKGSQAREVNMTVEQWDALQRQVEAELKEGYEADEEAEEYETAPC